MRSYYSQKMYKLKVNKFNKEQSLYWVAIQHLPADPLQEVRENKPAHFIFLSFMPIVMADALIFSKIWFLFFFLMF